MRSLLHDLAAVHHDDPVRRAHGCKAVSNDNPLPLSARQPCGGSNDFLHFKNKIEHLNLEVWDGLLLENSKCRCSRSKIAATSLRHV
jgi:hypothetical protein